jgi:hypothetical protein
MRRLTYGLVFVMAIVAMGPVLDAQEPAPFVAVRDCQINQGERSAFREAQRTLVEYIVANPIEAPGSLVGTFLGAVNNRRLYRFVQGFENLGEWDEWNRLNRQARRTDPQRQAVYREMFSHLNSCNWNFTRRIVNQ